MSLKEIERRISALEMRQPPRPRHCVQVIYDPRDGGPYPDEAAEFAKLVAPGTAKHGDDFLLIIHEIVGPARFRAALSSQGKRKRDPGLFCSSWPRSQPGRSCGEAARLPCDPCSDGTREKMRAAVCAWS